MLPENSWFGIITEERIFQWPLAPGEVLSFILIRAQLGLATGSLVLLQRRGPLNFEFNRIIQKYCAIYGYPGDNCVSYSRELTLAEPPEYYVLHHKRRAVVTVGCRTSFHVRIRTREGALTI